MKILLFIFPYIYRGKSALKMKFTDLQFTG